MSESFDSWGAEKPYPGLRPFRRDELDIFFGRDEQVYTILDRVAEGRFLAVVGSSGCGKSSLVKSGLLGGLESGLVESAGSTWRLTEMRPGNRPLARLAKALLKPSAFGNELEDESDLLLYRDLAEAPLNLVKTWERARLPEHANLIILVDQFEEIFRFRQEGDRHEADAFVDLLIETVKEARRRELPIYIVLTMRSDFLGDCTIFSGLPEMLNDSQYLTPRLERDDYREAIEGPAAVFGGEVEPALVNRLLNDTYGLEDPLPLMQHLLMRLWERATPDDDGKITLTLPDYVAEGGLDKSLSNHGDELFGALDPKEQAIAEPMFKRLCDLVVRRPTAVEEIAAVAQVETDDVIAVANRFRDPDCSFVMPPPGEDLHAKTTLDISHEALFRQWRKLEQWSQDEAGAAKSYRLMVDNARSHLEDKGEYYRGSNLREVKTWRRANRPNRTWARRYGTDDEWDDTERFIARSATRSRLRRVGAASIGVALAALGLLVIVAPQLATRRAGQAFELLEKARLQVEQMPHQALLLALTASGEEVVRRPAHDFIRGTLGRPIGHALEGNAETVAMSMSPDGEWLATLDNRCDLRLRRAEDEPSKPVLARIDLCEAAQDDPRGDFVLAVSSRSPESEAPQVAVGAADGRIEIWRLGSKASDRSTPAAEGLAVQSGLEKVTRDSPLCLRKPDALLATAQYALALSPDGRWLAADEGGPGATWNVRDLASDEGSCRPGTPLELPAGSRIDRGAPFVSLSNRALLATWGLWELDEEDRWKRRDLAKGELPIEEGRAGDSHIVTFARLPDEAKRRVRRQVLLRRRNARGNWDLPEILFETSEKKQSPRSIRLAEPSGLLWVGRDDGRVQVWDLTEPGSTRTIPRPDAHIPSEEEGAHTVLYRQNILAVQGNGAIRLWELPDRIDDLFELAAAPIPQRKLEGLESATRHTSLSRNGRYLVATTEGGELRRWDTAVEGACRSVASGPGESVGAISISSNGDWVAYGQESRPTPPASGQTAAAESASTYHLKFSFLRGQPREQRTSGPSMPLRFIDSLDGDSTWIAYVDTGPEPGRTEFERGRLVVFKLPRRSAKGVFEGGSRKTITFGPPEGWVFSRHFKPSPEGGYFSLALEPAGRPDSQSFLLGVVTLDDIEQGACAPPSLDGCWRTAELAGPLKNLVVSGQAGRRVLVHAGNQFARLVDLESGQAVDVTMDKSPAVTALTEARLLLGGADGSVSVLEMADVAWGGQAAATRLGPRAGNPAGHAGPVTQLRFKPSARAGESRRWLVSAAVDGRVLTWDLANPTDEPKDLVPPGPEGSVQLLSFSADGSLLLTGGSTGTVAVWQIAGKSPGVVDRLFRQSETLPALRVRTAHSDEVVTGWLVGPPANGDDPLEPYALATASKDGTVCHRELGTVALKDELRRVVGRNLYETEWKIFDVRGDHSPTFEPRPDHWNLPLLPERVKVPKTPDRRRRVGDENEDKNEDKNEDEHSRHRRHR